jgi:GH25 family lysozyme M1 (1,4-beta-N-acetylmuramidase)
MVIACLARIAERFGRRPIVYTSRSFMKECLGSSTALSGYPLWVVDYSQDPPRLPAGWKEWTFWQHSETGDAAGVTPLDLDRYRGDLASLLAFIDGSVSPVVHSAVPTRARLRTRR